MPIGILVALYLTEFAKGQRSASAIKLALDLMNGLPSIIIGLFVFGLLVVGHEQSGFAASVALAIIMLPLIARGSQEVLLLVPNSHARSGRRARGQPLAHRADRDPAERDRRASSPRRSSPSPAPPARPRR